MSVRSGSRQCFRVEHDLGDIIVSPGRQFDPFAIDAQLDGGSPAQRELEGPRSPVTASAATTQQVLFQVLAVDVDDFHPAVRGGA